MHRNALETGKAIETESRLVVAEATAERRVGSDCWSLPVSF